MPAFGKKKGITKIREEISETQASKTAEKKNEGNQALVFDNINKSDKTLILKKKKKKKIKIKYRNTEAKEETLLLTQQSK